MAAGADIATALVHFIDVGQGNAVLFEFPCGTVLIDTGGEQADVFPSEARLLAYLETVFARRTDLNRTLDLVVLTHPHIDHTRGAKGVRDRFTVRNVVDNGQNNNTVGGPQQNELRGWAQQRNIPYRAIRVADLTASEGLTDATIDPIGACTRGRTDPKITALWGGSESRTGAYSSPNNHSVVLRVDYGNFSALVTGDLQSKAINDMIDAYAEAPAMLDVDVYEAGHHGSHNATTGALVEIASPKAAVVSMGDPNRTEGEFIAYEFGHPNHLAMAELLDETYGVSCYRTPVWAPVGLKGRNPRTRAAPEWEEWQIAGAVFATGWDGNVVVRALPSGTFTVETHKADGETMNPGLSCE